MSRQFSTLCVVLVGALAVAAGCSPQQPFYFHEDGDLSHYIGKATEIEYPDVEAASLDEVTGAMPPLTLENPDPAEYWELTLEEAMRIALDNSKVIRSLSMGRFRSGPGSLGSVLPDYLQTSPDAAMTVYYPALHETGTLYGRYPQGVEAALAAFDTQFTTGVFWEKNDTPQNVAGFVEQFRPGVFEQELGTFQAQLKKTAVTGATWSLTHNVVYEGTNVPLTTRRWMSDWNVNLEAEFRQPFLQGYGVQYNRIAGPGSPPGYCRGVMIARVDTDISLADFEGQVRNLVSDVETRYWALYFAYRKKSALSDARDKALDTWRKVRTEYETGTSSAQDEAQARHQYFYFSGQVKDAQSELYSAERNLRYMLGLAPTDGRLIRPADEPTTARVQFDWHDAHSEALVRSMHLRRQKWQIKRSEMELIAAKNHLLPRLDAVGRYRWLGLGDRLIDSNNSVSNAFGSMTDGEFQEWQLGFDLTIPLGFRTELAAVRNAQLQVARQRAILQELEFEVSHALSHALGDLEKEYQLAQSYFDQLAAAETELQAWEAREKEGLSVRDKALDRKLDAQQRVANAEMAYYERLVYYNLAIAQVHFRKGSLLEYNGIYLAEGPWPAKAYFDATRRARARDAGLYLDYGFTRPKVISRGPYDQHAGTSGPIFATEPVPAGDVPAEAIPTPQPEPLLDQLPEPDATSVLEKGEPESVKLRLGSNPPVNTSSQNRPSANEEEYDLASLDLKMLAGKPAHARSAPTVEKSSVQPVTYQEVDAATGGGKPQPIESGWKSTNRSSAGHESVANPSTPEADRNASGWKGVQR